MRARNLFDLLRDAIERHPQNIAVVPPGGQ
jgi:hypothetical protein